MGLPQEPTNTNESDAAYQKWFEGGCQPNFYDNVVGASTSCPPYVPIPTATYTPVPEQGRSLTNQPPLRRPRAANPYISRTNHGKCGHAYDSVQSYLTPTADTIGMCALDKAGRLAVGGSTNGATYKVRRDVLPCALHLRCCRCRVFITLVASDFWTQ